MSITAVFFLTGAVVAAWSTRIPAIQEHLHLGPAALGMAILGLEGGAIIGLPMGGALVTRLGSRWSLRAGFAVYPTALLGLAAAPSLPILALALAVMAAGNSVVDVAMNAQDVNVERRYGRPILSSMHAEHRAGLLAGGWPVRPRCRGRTTSPWSPRWASSPDRPRPAGWSTSQPVTADPPSLVPTGRWCSSASPDRARSKEVGGVEPSASRAE